MARGSAWMKHSTEIFAESFGAYGWSEGLRMLKWIGDWLIVNGINVISPHAVSMKFHDPDCPPHYNASSGNPAGAVLQRVVGAVQAAAEADRRKRAGLRRGGALYGRIGLDGQRAERCAGGAGARDRADFDDGAAL